MSKNYSIKMSVEKIYNVFLTPEQIKEAIINSVLTHNDMPKPDNVIISDIINKTLKIQLIYNEKEI